MSPIVKKAFGAGQQTGTEALARTLYKELRSNGCDTDTILAICTQMLDEVTSELKEDSPAEQASASAA